jgi:hypothetical protein
MLAFAAMKGMKGKYDSSMAHMHQSIHLSIGDARLADLN